MEGQSQPDLLNILRKQQGGTPPPPPSPPPETAAPKEAKALSKALAAAGERPARPGRRDAWILVVLAVVVAALVAAVFLKRMDDPQKPGAKPAEKAPAPAKPAPARPAPAKAAKPAPPEPAGSVKVYTPGAQGSGRTFNTLMLATYPGGKMAEAQATCEHLRRKDPDFKDVFLYKKDGKLSLCAGRFERPFSDAKAQALAKKAHDFPNAQGLREFQSCYFIQLTVAEP